MARVPHLPAGATRFFARPLSAVLECPRCGQVLYFQSGSRRNTVGWDKRTSELTCWSCRKVLVIGILAWPVARTRLERTQPRDQTPDERQLAQLRAMGGQGAGFWLPPHQAVKPRRPEHTNMTAGCTCWNAGTGNFDWRDDCPIHGDEVEEAEEDGGEG